MKANTSLAAAAAPGDASLLVYKTIAEEIKKGEKMTDPSV